MSTEDHPDWWRPVGGSNAQDSTLERRSLVWNDNGVLDGVAPPAFYTDEEYKGKFFTRGMRGMIESIQVYCDGDGVDTLTLRYSPHPCLGPVGEVSIIPAAGWAWQDFPIEEMWDYDSLFIWVYTCTVNIDWAYDTEQPYDGHESTDAGATWADMNIRPFIRVVYTGETPGDVPVSGIINNIPIPSASSRFERYYEDVPQNVLTTIITVEGAGYVDYIEAVVGATTYSEETEVRVYCDDVLAMQENYEGLSVWGFTASTPTVSLPKYLADSICVMLIHKRFEFRRIFEVRVINDMTAFHFTCNVHPTLMR